ncbi:isopentenyl-diphosphate delta-isomerase [Halioglobus japonicus]|nr:isopentenyl-diphosphate delta-isomerase [Halioglobus japonicus]
MQVNDHYERVLLVDTSDRVIGYAGKLDAHRNGSLHRAFSVFGVDTEGRVLIQQRALSKYHCGGLWANTCCGHPRPGETVQAGAVRRLNEEFGLRACLRPLTATRYCVNVDSGLVEHEIAHIFVCRIDASPQPNPSEIAQYDYVTWEELLEDVRGQPAKYAPWLHHYLTHLSSELERALRVCAPEDDQTQGLSANK